MQLVHLTIERGLRACNGRFPSDTQCSNTFARGKSKSRIDYVMITTAHRGYIQDFKVDSRGQREHFPLCLSLSGRLITTYSTYSTNTGNKYPQLLVSNNRRSVKWFAIMDQVESLTNIYTGFCEALVPYVDKSSESIPIMQIHSRLAENIKDSLTKPQLGDRKLRSKIQSLVY